MIRRVLSGIRPTGPLHLGHYVGALKPWIEAQDDPDKIECFFLIADYQAGTTHAKDRELIQRAIREVYLDFIAVGLNPELAHVHFVLQSEVSRRADLSLYFDLIANYNELLDNPTVKSELEVLKMRKVAPTVSFVRYPVDQVADIYMVSPENKAGNELLIPVGKDQIPHLESARRFARLFNKRYEYPLFRACTPRVSDIPHLVGIDGDAKMSKSIGNTIDLSEPMANLRSKVNKMPTDPARSLSMSAPGDPKKAIAFLYLDAFNPDREETLDMKLRYGQGKIGDGAIKSRLIQVLTEFLEPIQERRLKAEADNLMLEHLESGTKRASELCEPIVDQMKKLMGLGFVR